MRSPQQLTLPLAPAVYTQSGESTVRRSIEQGYQLLRVDLVSIRDHNEAQASLAMRRHQFLLMGA